VPVATSLVAPCCQGAQHKPHHADRERGAKSQCAPLQVSNCSAFREVHQPLARVNAAATNAARQPSSTSGSSSLGAGTQETCNHVRLRNAGQEGASSSNAQFVLASKLCKNSGEVSNAT
jgi:hypothetical protein